MPWSRGCDRRRALGAFWAQKSNWFTPIRRPTDWSGRLSAATLVNLAGEPLMGGRWTAARRAALEGSRIAVTEQLVRAMAEARSRPRVFISGSAVGYYGDRTDELFTEASSAADDFLASLCRRWECAAQEADRLGARVVLLRTGSRQPSFVVEAPAQAASVAWTYTVLGVEHILAGIDHLLYIIAMLSRNGLEAHRLADVGIHDTPDVERGSPGLGPMCRNRRWKRGPAILLGGGANVARSHEVGLSSVTGSTATEGSRSPACEGCRKCGITRCILAAAILEKPVSDRGTLEDVSQSPILPFKQACKLLILNGEMSEWSIEHAWKLIPLARADAHRNAPTHSRSATSRNKRCASEWPRKSRCLTGVSGGI
jgi:hypothetical protein